MSKESREIEKLNPDQEVGKRRKIVFWSMIATGVGMIIVVVLLLIFLIPKEEKYEISLGSSGTSIEVELTGEGSYKKGDSVTIVAEDIDGYRFTGWSYGGNIISTDKEYTFQINEENEGEYTASYAKIYSVSTFDSDNYGSFTVAPTEAIAGETVTVRYEVNSENQDKYQLKRLYYVIAGESDQVTIENNTFTMPEGNVTIYAEFNNLYNINLTTNIDEEVDLTGEGTYIENETVTISAPNIAGYRFRNWTYNGQVVTTQQEYIIANIDSTTSGTYIANYDRLYSITVNSSHGTVAIVDNKTNAIENENIEFTVEPNSDYRLIEVKVNNETLQAQDGKYSFAMPAENVTIDVTYSQLFDISVTSEHGDVTIVDNKTEAIANENVSFTVQAESGYRIDSVSINNGDITYINDENTYSFTMPAENVTIVVTYIQQLKVILQSDMENADLSGADTYDIGSEVTITASTYVEDQDGNQYRFIGWQHNEEFIPAEEGGIYEFILSADTAGTYTAIYEEEHTITIDTQSQNTIISISADKAYSGENVTMQVNEETQVTDDSVIFFASRLYYKTADSEEEVEIYKQDGQYSFIMPSADITIYAEYEDRDRYQNFVFYENTVYYLGNDSTVVIPSSYSMIQLDGDNILNFENKEELDKIMQSQIASMQINTGYFQVKTSNDEEYSTELITDVQTWYQGLTEDQFPLSIKLPTNLSKAQNGNGVEDVVERLGTQLLIGRVKSFDIKVDDDPVVTVDSLEDYNAINTPEIHYSTNLEISNIVYFEKVFYVGNEVIVSQLGGIAGSFTEVVIPASIIATEHYLFKDNTTLETVTFEEGSQLQSLSYGMFMDCRNLKNIEIPSSVTVIEDLVFYGCSSLTSIEIPEGVTSIGNNAFYGCSGLTEIVIPEKVKNIGAWAFNVCPNLTNITIESKDIYQAATGQSQAGYLLQKATTVKVLKTIDDGSNTFLSTTGGYTLDDSSDPKYNIYTK